MPPEDEPTIPPPAPADIEAALHKAAPNAVRVTVTTSFVLHYPGNDDCAAYALVTGRETARTVGTEICVGSWSISLISAECAVGRAVVTQSNAGLGDCVTIRLPDPTLPAPTAQIVSWNGSPLLTGAERMDCRQKQEEARQSAVARQKERQQRAARRAKEEGVVADLRARRLAKEAAWRAK